MEQDLNSIRSGARIEYVGQFTAPKPDATSQPMTAAPLGSATAQQDPAQQDKSALDKGLAGLR